MKRLILELSDKELMDIMPTLFEMSKRFTVETVVARDPMVYAALPPTAPPEAEPEYASPYKDPMRVEAGRKAVRNGPYTYEKAGRQVQRLTNDGRTAYEVVEQKVKSFKGRRFHIGEIQDLSVSSGFRPNTLQNQLGIMVGRSKLVRLNKFYFKAPKEVDPSDHPLERGSPSPAPAERGSDPSSTARFSDGGPLFANGKEHAE